MFNLKEYQKKYQEENKEKIQQQKKEYAIKWRETFPDKAILVSAKYRARLNNLAFNLEDADIILPEYCPVLGIKLYTHAGKGHNIRKDSYSLDRIDPEKGYTKGNVQVISGLANRMKQNATPEELILFAEWVLKTYKGIN